MSISRSIVYAMLLLAVGMTAVAGTDGTELRTWTSQKGQTVEAVFERVEHGVAHLKKADGKSVRIRTGELIREDQQLLKELKSDQAVSTNSASLKTVAGSVLSTNTSSLKRNSGVGSEKAPEAMHELFGSKLRTARKKTVSVDELAGKTIGVYFSAHWCPPCRGFTPKLVDFYNELKEADKPFEVVFVSSDRDRKAMYSYMEETEMPWLALRHGDKHKESLSKKFSVSGIPKLVILDSSGELITADGRSDVMRGVSAYDKWTEK